MNLLQKIRCFRCCRRADCALMDALLAKRDEWRRTEKPKLDAALKSADELLIKWEKSKQVT